MSKTRKKYTPEFKQEAVKLAEKVGFTKAASELGVYHDNIRRWSKSLNSIKNGDEPNSSSSPSKAFLESENRRLQKEINYLKKINEVLKKSTAIFSGDHIGGLK